MKLKPYSSYKKVELNGLDEAPKHWDIVRLRYIFKEVEEKTSTGNEQLLSLTKKRGLISHSESTEKLSSADSLIGYRVCRPNNLVMNRMQAWNGMFDVAKTIGLVSPDYTVLEKIVEASDAYLLYVVKSPNWVREFRKRSKGLGTGFNRLYTHDFGDISVPIPPLEEQKTIVQFLERKLERIDTFVRQKRKLIALLLEQKQALINRAVTRGLDGGVDLKDSGVEWLGEIPAHWSVVPLRSEADVGNGSTPSRSSATYWVNGHYPWLTSGKLNEKFISSAGEFVTDIALKQCHLPIVKPNSILIALTGEGKTRGTAALLLTESTISQHIAYITPKKQGWNARFLYYILDSLYFWMRHETSGTGSTKAAITCTYLKELKIPKLSLEEQNRIVEYIEREIDLIDKASVYAEQEIELIEEYRTTLISDCVTGKLDVRDYGARAEVNAASETELLNHFPYRDMVKKGLLEGVKDKLERVRLLCKFMAVQSLSEVLGNYRAAFRRQASAKTSPYALAAWLRWGLLESQGTLTRPLNRVALEALVHDIPALTMENIKTALPKLRERLAACGVALAVIDPLEHTGAQGAVMWQNKKVTLLLTLRRKYADIFWFTLLHELGHLLLGHVQPDQDFVDLEQHEFEAEADRYAREGLIRQSEWEAFLKRLDFLEGSVQSFALEQGVGVGIVVGRLQREEWIHYSQLTTLRTKLEFIHTLKIEHG